MNKRIFVLSLLILTIFSMIPLSVSARSSTRTIIQDALYYNYRSKSIYIYADYQTMESATPPREILIDLDWRIPDSNHEEYSLSVGRCGYLNPYGLGMWVSLVNIIPQSGGYVAHYSGLFFIGENGIYFDEYSGLTYHKRNGYYNVDFGEDFAIKPIRTENGIYIKIRNSNGWRDFNVYRFHYEIEESIWDSELNWVTFNR